MLVGLQPIHSWQTAVQDLSGNNRLVKSVDPWITTASRRHKPSHRIITATICRLTGLDQKHELKENVMIITIYHKDGRKERRPIGYSGEQCHQATAPYEVRERPGKATKTPTPEAYTEQVEQSQQQHVGG